MNGNQDCAKIESQDYKNGWSWRRRAQQLIWRLRYWLFLNVWCRHLYRPTMRLLHRYNLHYAPVTPLSPRYGKRVHYCQWCGLWGNTWKIDPNESKLVRPIGDSQWKADVLAELADQRPDAGESISAE